MKKEAKEVAKRLLVQLKQNFTSTGLKNLINDHAPLVKLAGLKWVHLINCNFIVAVIVELLILSRKKLGHDEIYFASSYEKNAPFLQVCWWQIYPWSTSFFLFFSNANVFLKRWKSYHLSNLSLSCIQVSNPRWNIHHEPNSEKKIKKRSQQIVTYIVKVCTF